MKVPTLAARQPLALGKVDNLPRYSVMYRFNRTNKYKQAHPVKTTKGNKICVDLIQQRYPYLNCTLSYVLAEEMFYLADLQSVFKRQVLRNYLLLSRK